MVSYISALLLIIGLLNPEHFPPWISWHNEVSIFAAVLLVVASGFLNISKHENESIKIPNLTLVGVLLSGVVIAQYILGSIVFFGDALVIIFYVIVGMLAAGIGFHASLQLKIIGSEVKKNRTIELFAFTIVVAAACSAAISLVQTTNSWGGTSWIATMPNLRRPGANLAQPNQLATLLIMGIASVVFLFEVGRLRAAAASALYILLASGVAVSESRTGLLSFVVIVAWYVALHRSLNFKVDIKYGALAIFVVFFLFWFWPPLFSFLDSGGLLVSGDGAQVNTKLGTRLTVWPQLIDAVFQKPMFGWGLGELSKAHNNVVHTYATSDAFTYAHNIILDLAIGVGLPLTALLVGVVVNWLYQRSKGAKTLLTWYCVAIILPFGVHSLLEFPFAYAYFLVPVLFSVGMLEGMLAPKRYFHLAWRPAVAAQFVLTLVMACSVLEYLAAEEDFRIARFEVAAIGKTANDYQRPNFYLLTQLDSFLEGVRVVPAPGMTTKNIELSRNVAMRFPSEATQNRYALSLALNGNLNEALRQLKVMRVMHGEAAYKEIRANWTELASKKYPQLQGLAPP